MFCAVYEALYDERKTYDKKSAINALLKLALNGTYGKSNDKYSCFYDPKFTMSITINGQLSLCMLAEQLLKVPTLKMLMCNTDGLTFSVDQEYEDDAHEVCKQWEVITNLELERAEYQSMLIRDVNNYIAVYKDGKTKCKGAYEYANLAWNKDHSMLVVPKAVEYAFVNDLGDVGIEKYIKKELDNIPVDMYDYMIRFKAPKSCSVYSETDTGIKTYQQNTGRCYATTTGAYLFKEMPPTSPTSEVIRLIKDDDTKDFVVGKKTTEIEVEKHIKRGWEVFGELTVDNPNRIMSILSGQKVSICNRASDFDFDKLDYDWYIQQAKKLLSFGDDDNENEDDAEE